MNEVLYSLCRHCVSIMDGYYPYPSTGIARNTGMSLGKVRYQLKKLKKDGLVESFYMGGQDEEGNVYCMRGFTITEKAKQTQEYMKALEEEKKIVKKCFEIDI